ncbi:ATP-binding cassette domain-containing protein [Acholeplasma vituli]|uniref:ATP-binding cassette domain-containing protein n=1 Tax=Paracholeplasma vituli TaxID=69473 RepID=A0ABT2PUI9_9MOLU|nr:ATP-binding cassette domain-containing protein [Paracholeplasma vituli]MCU0104610.1 ATP-binding cassette domain-containing protein [Paracholeplasma vituli]
MITVSNLSLVFPDKKLFEDVNIKFTAGNCYGVIGANGAGKSTFLKILAGEKDSTKGEVIIDKGKRLATLKQNHNAYDDFTVMETVIMGHKELYDIMKQKEVLYSKTDFTEEEGFLLADLEVRFAELDGWNAEVEVEKLLNGLNVPQSDFYAMMSDVLPKNKVKVLLAQALFGNPDILLLDEPTNHLDFEAIHWLEEFLINYDNTVITVSHDRHFLNNVCTHMVDIDYYQAKLYPGNYDFWMESSQLIQKLMNDRNKKKEERMEELKAFIARFSANLSKSRQATSRKKSLEKIQLEDIVPSLRKYPFIGFDIEKQLGKDVIEVENINYTYEGKTLLKNVSFVMTRGDKVALLGENDLAKTALLRILAGELEPDSGSIKWGQTVQKAYFPADNEPYFQSNMNLIDWLRRFSKDPAESYIRGFLGRMLFTGDQPLKEVKYLSGGEKMRCMFSKLMMSNANTLIVDSPTNHLDLESIEAVNNGLSNYQGAIILSSHDHRLLDTVCNKIVEIGDLGSMMYQGTLDEYISNPNLKERQKALYSAK